jgi:formate dehydrogenase major subunit
MTNHWADIKNADVVLVMGGNAAEAHPCGFKWVTEAKAHNNATFMVVDPRFNRSAALADLYAPIRTGTDIAFLGGVINYLLENDKIQHEYVKAYTNAPLIVAEGYWFKDGLFSGYNEDERVYDKSTWAYDTGPDGYARVDETLEHPRCVFQLLKKHYSGYTPEIVTGITGTPLDKFLKVCEIIASTSVPDRTLTILYALGWTQHSVGSQMIRTAAMLQLLLGNVGMAGGGVNALRGHSNIQGLTDMGLLSNLLPGYLTLPVDGEISISDYLKKRTLKPVRPGQLSYWSNYPKFHVSLMKAFFGEAATPENDWCYNWLPKLDQSYDVLRVFDMMRQGKVNGYFCQGFNPLASIPNKAKVISGLSQLKYLVVIDPLATETSCFWENHGEYNDVDSAKIPTEVFRLPSGCFAEENGSLTNSSRWLQWHWQGAPPPGEAKSDRAIMAGIFLKLRELYSEEGGAFPEPILNLTWDYKISGEPSAEELAREYNGKAMADLTDPKDPAKVLVKKGQQLDSFAQLRDDGTTSCGCWIYTGAWTEKGNIMARHDNADPSGLGLTPNWTFSWPANRRVLYNRASCDPSGKPWDPKRVLIEWNGEKWIGSDVPDFKPDSAPAAGMNPFIMQPEGMARLFALDKMAEGPFPEHYEPFETPIGTNPLHPDVVSNPAARVFMGDLEQFGKAGQYPYAGTTYRLTEHFHFWTKHTRLAAITQPEQFVEIGEELAEEKGIRAGDRVKVTSNRGQILAVAVVTKRMMPMEVNGKTIHHVGIPIHWGFKGIAKNGYLANTLTPFVGDANTETPEFKSFLVNIEKA